MKATMGMGRTVQLDWKAGAARLLFITALALCAFAILLIAVALVCAKQDRMWPVPDPSEWSSNHGPWDFYSFGLKILDNAFRLSIVATVMGIVSGILKPRAWTWLLVAANAALVWNLFGWIIYLGD